MDSLASTNCRKKKRLSAEGVADTSIQVLRSPAPSPTSHTGSKNGTSLDNYYKKVQQSRASRCKKTQTHYFVCKRGHVAKREIRCNRRFVRECPYCARIWRNKTRKRYSAIVSRMKSPKHVVLTLRKGGMHKIEELSKLVQRCRFYIRRKKYKIRKFVFCIAPPNHVHAIWDCDFIPQKGLLNIWKTITGDSFEVWIKRVDRHRWKGAVNYVVKYITKISNSGAGMRRMHLIGSWGNVLRKRIRMICKKCGCYFHRLYDLDYMVEKYVAFEYIEVDRG